jgi:hypothetical protein
MVDDVCKLAPSSGHDISDSDGASFRPCINHEVTMHNLLQLQSNHVLNMIVYVSKHVLALF